MEEDLDLPIALRRTRRSLGPSTQQISTTPAACASPALRPRKAPSARTPPKSSKKPVRFSDRGPHPANTTQPTTGLTPAIRRASLAGCRTPRRRSIPARLCPSSGTGIPEVDSHGSPFGGEVRFLPLRQVLDGRVKRRIRRNGLSEEMNAIAAEKRRRAEAAKAEIERLKAELAEKDEEIQRLHDETAVVDTERVWDLEQQVQALKKELTSRSEVQQTPSSPGYDWAGGALSPDSDRFSDVDFVDAVEDFGEATRADLISSTPTPAARTLPHASFPTPPATSPDPQAPSTPCRKQPTLRPSVGTQAALPDPGKQRLEEQLELLQLEVSKLTAKLETYSALSSRLSDKLAPFSPRPSSEGTDSDDGLEERLTAVLQSLSDRTAALAELDSSLKSLGFSGSDALEVVDSLRAGFRSARLALEYLTPGENTLPLTGAGAGVLDQVLARLRHLADQKRAADESIDEYHALELSLRQQLSARVTAMDDLASRLAAAEHGARAKDARIAELEVGLDRLRHTAQTYTRDIADLERLVERIESDFAARAGDLAASRTHNTQLTTTLAEKTTALAALEEKLAAALTKQSLLQSDLDALSATHAHTLEAHKEELSSLGASRDAAVARVAELQAEVERGGAALREAHEAARRLRAERDRLAQANGALSADKRRAQAVVGGMKAELERVMRMGEGFLRLAGEVGEQDVGGGGDVAVPRVEGTAGRLVGQDGESLDRGPKRRKYDSGLGLLDGEEVDEVCE